MKVQKPRADSKLKTLPIGKQAEIVVLVGNRTLTDGVKLLREQGINVSIDTLSRFLSWWPVQQASLGSQVAELVFELREVKVRLDRQSAAIERQSQQGRATLALLKNELLSDADLRDNLRRVFGI